MTFKTPSLLLDTIVVGGAGRTKQSLAATCGLTFLAGAYIALGGFLAIRCGAFLPVSVWGSMAKFVFAAVFPLGLMLVIVCGADLFTGNCMRATIAGVAYTLKFPLPKAEAILVYSTVSITVAVRPIFISVIGSHSFVFILTIILLNLKAVCKSR